MEYQGPFHTKCHEDEGVRTFPYAVFPQAATPSYPEHVSATFPRSLNMNSLQLRFRGVMTGDTVPLTVRELRTQRSEPSLVHSDPSPCSQCVGDRNTGDVEGGGPDYADNNLLNVVAQYTGSSARYRLCIWGSIVATFSLTWRAMFVDPEQFRGLRGGHLRIAQSAECLSSVMTDDKTIQFGGPLASMG
jgi:hypothetical protein